ncbi:hypothetical protein [Pseudomarimonas salicorniae]|uniref:4-amino-4-deoxy-L-arabinose transferase n=1 Tax=Pseudomarimonas salicorniae TaxID=2933270 RepID=A0ABT0GFJ4_9GAMM|nr:hypothetical protein [Lysobacter sp. CAU 1642]MCK7593320.1 hypothetical protein [Lysobacter sp. CAU 1642]
MAVVLATGLFGSLTFLPSVQLIGEYGFLGADSFYHALRIMGATDSGWVPREFDTQSYVPTGHLVAWPWLYDSLMSLVLGLLRIAMPTQDPAMLLGAVPPAFFLLNGALILLISKQAGLAPSLRLLALLLFCWSPNVHFVHGFGHIDHHFAETTSVLCVTLATMRWFDSPDSNLQGILCGVALSVSQGIATSLIVLFAPVLLLFGVVWCRGRSGDFAQSARYFAASMLVTQTLLLLPSQAFLELKFAYYWFSWFHLAASIIVAVLVGAMAASKPSPRTIQGLTLLACLALLLSGTQIMKGMTYLSGDLPLYEGILEVESVYASLTGGSFWITVARYTPLLLLTPWIGFQLSKALATEPRVDGRAAMACFALLGLALAMAQYRFNYFAYLGLSVGAAWMLLRYQVAETGKLRWPGTLLALSFALACIPGWRLHATAKPLAGSVEFSSVYPIYLSLRQVCADRPGTVLARWDHGHYARYFSRCGVLANNMVVTPVQTRGALQVMDRFRKPAAALPGSEPRISYVLVHNSRLASSSATELLEEGVLEPLEAELFSDRLPEGFSLVAEHRVPLRDGSLRPIARIVEVSRNN